jgi:hypothetical protein
LIVASSLSVAVLTTKGEDPDLLHVAVAAGRRGHPRMRAGVLAYHPQPGDHLVTLADELLHQHAALSRVGRAEGRQLLAKALDGGTGLVGLAEDDLVVIYHLRRQVSDPVLRPVEHPLVQGVEEG